MLATDSILTADQIALQNHIEGLNEKTRAWMAEAEGRWAGMLVSDPSHWAEYGIFSVDEFVKYETVNLAYELHKDRYGFKPNYGELKKMSLAELDEMIESLSAIPVMAESVDSYEW